MSPSPGLPDVTAIKRELQQLSNEQGRALDKAVYGGMSRTELKEYDDRATKIRKLIHQLNRLEDLPA